MTEKKRYILFYKPYGILSQFTGADPKETLSAFDLPKNIYPAGRLDKNSEGLLLLTNDGPFIKKLLDPVNAHPRTYWVQVENIPTETSLQKLKNGLTIKKHLTKSCKVKKIKEPVIKERIPPIRFRKNIPTSWIEITLTEGKNRQVRRMTASIGHPTLRLLRVGIGKLKIDLLTEGKWIEVSKNQIID